MKKTCVVIVLILFFCVSFAPTFAFANSAQRQFMGVAASGALITTENCPVTVSAERLTFNINSYPEYGFDESYNANVTAEYDFYNPESYDVYMQLVFPFGSLPDYARYGYDYADKDKYSVSVNGVEAETVIRATYYNPYSSDFDISRDLPRISDEPIPFKNYDDNTVVYVYELKNVYENVGAREYVADFSYDEDIILFLETDGYFYRMYDEDLQSNSVFRLRSSDSLIVYSVGAMLPDEFFSPKYYAINEKSNNYYVDDTEKPVSGSTSVKLSTFSLGELVMRYYDEDSSVSRLDYRNAVAECFETFAGYYGLEVLDINDNLMLWYQYDLSVPSKQTVTNKVVAPLYPDYDAYYNPIKYNYVYLLSPARSWAGFADLDVVINTQSYMLECSLKGFEKTEYGYFAHFDTLPKEELIFELCASQNPEYDRSRNSFAVTLIILLLVIPCCVIVAVAIVVPTVIVCVRKKRKRRQAQQDEVCSADKRDEAMKNFFDNGKKL